MIEFTSWEDPVVGLEVKPFNWRLRKARQARGWTRAELARQCGVTASTVGVAEKLGHVSSQAREAIALALEVPEDALFPGVIDALPSGGPGVLEIPFAEEQVQRWIDGGSLDPMEARTEHLALSAVVRDAVAGLHPSQREVLEKRFGLADDDPRTLDEIGDDLSISKERVRQIEAAGLRSLRKVSRGFFSEWDIFRERSETPAYDPRTLFQRWRDDCAKGWADGADPRMRESCEFVRTQPCCAVQTSAATLVAHAERAHNASSDVFAGYQRVKHKWDDRQGRPAKRGARCER